MNYSALLAILVCCLAPGLAVATPIFLACSFDDKRRGPVSIRVDEATGQLAQVDNDTEKMFKALGKFTSDRIIYERVESWDERIVTTRYAIDKRSLDYTGSSSYRAMDVEATDPTVTTMYFGRCRIGSIRQRGM